MGGKALRSLHDRHTQVRTYNLAVHRCQISVDGRGLSLCQIARGLRRTDVRTTPPQVCSYSARRVAANSSGLPIPHPAQIRRGLHDARVRNSGRAEILGLPSHDVVN